MAKVEFTGEARNRDLLDFFNLGAPLSVYVEEFGTYGHLSDNINLAGFTVHGSNLAEGTGEQENTFISGRIERINLTSFALTLATVQGDYKAVELSEAADKGGASAVIKFIFAGADTFIGSAQGDNLQGYGGKDTLKGNKGQDNLDGGAGRGDTLIGGKDSDYFLLAKRNGADVVADFDFKGKDHDWISIKEDAGFKLDTNKKGDVVLMSEGASLTLDGVSKAEFNTKFVTTEVAEATWEM